MPAEASIRDYYHALLSAWGPQDWWPARSRFEVITGAFLTQNTAWANVERALANLRRARLLSVAGIRRTPLRRLEQLIRPAGYFRQKAARLKTFVQHLDSRYRGSLARMFARPTAELRAELLALNGVGPETADSILLYAGGHASFVVDAYTRRILERHHLINREASYEEVRALFERSLIGEPAPRSPALTRNSKPETRNTKSAHVAPAALGRGAGRSPALGPAALVRSPKFAVPQAPPTARVYNEYHALLVRAAKHHCLKKQAQCIGCPLEPFLPR